MGRLPPDSDGAESTAIEQNGSFYAVGKSNSGNQAAQVLDRGSYFLEIDRRLANDCRHMWAVEGTVQMPPGPLPPRMTIARVASGELVIFSAIALNNAEMAEVDLLGLPAFIVVPIAVHREDAQAWKGRLPVMRVSRLRKLVPQLPR